MESMEFVNRKSERGFTLVELAIVMIIIGLLIGGILKGQELINNARVSAAVAQIKGIDAALTTFRDKYDGMPGDLVTPGTRLAGCTAAPCTGPGDGDTRIESPFGAGATAEGQAAFPQLAAADLISGIDSINAADATWGGNYPQTEIGGGFMISYFAGGALLQSQVGGTAADVKSGHYLAMHDTPGGAVAATGVITPNQAFRVDNKLDDGDPDTGSVLSAGAAGCINAGAYQEDLDVANCNLYIRIQQ